MIRTVLIDFALCSLAFHFALADYITDTGNLRNALKLKFKLFQDAPRTEAEALAMNFTKVSDDCENGNFRGKQYMKDGDAAVIPLYDVNGYIAGMQTGVPMGLENNYPPQSMQPPFIVDGNHYKLTTYFVNPSIICKGGRSKQQFRRTGTGQDLFIQTGPNPEVDILEVTEYQNETQWVQGLCFPKMGFHYFKEVSMDMSCETFFPVALLYYHGKLQGFVWSLGAVLNSTYVGYEYPTPDFFDSLLKEVPTCLRTLRRSTLHVYFRDNIDSFTCEDPPPQEDKCTAGSAHPVLGRLLVLGFVASFILKAVW
ncbi:uncharacterized protein LOC128559156 [Mercenaria mercenaria]|uniref:uncharacterized protein LOC128559156 n=1 Tax=Mercenaria mercenaria TaxID=6596 RepID=UPI00234EEE1E|nr:uncharacterized protein LOC128559156 [Mercenaria mercenaria]